MNPSVNLLFLSLLHPYPLLITILVLCVSQRSVPSGSFCRHPLYLSYSPFLVLVAVIFVAVSRVVVPNALFLVTLSLSSTLASLLLSSSSCHNSRVSREVAVAVPMLVACYRCILVVVASSSTFLVIVLVLVLIPIRSSSSSCRHPRLVVIVVIVVFALSHAVAAIACIAFIYPFSCLLPCPRGVVDPLLSSSLSLTSSSSSHPHPDQILVSSTCGCRRPHLILVLFLFSSSFVLVFVFSSSALSSFLRWRRNCLVVLVA